MSLGQFGSFSNPEMDRESDILRALDACRVEIKRLRQVARDLNDEVEMWKDRYESERQAHEVTTKWAEELDRRHPW